MTTTPITVGRLQVAALVAGIIAFLATWPSGGLHAFTWALLGAALVAVILAALRQYQQTGSAPGAVITGGAILTLVLNAVMATLPSLLAAPQTQAGLVAYALVLLGYVEEELVATPTPAPTTPTKP